MRHAPHRADPEKAASGSGAAKNARADGLVHHSILIGEGQCAGRQRSRKRKKRAGSTAVAAGSTPRAKHSASVGAMKPGIFEKPSAATRWLVSWICGLLKRPAPHRDIAPGRVDWA